MKKIFGAVILFFLPILSSYGQENPNVSPDLSDITIKNFPVIDGSDSTKPLRLILASKLLGFDYVWQKSISGGQGPDAHPNEVMPKYTGDFDDIRELRVNRLKNSNTHGSFMYLIDDKVELIITARSLSRDEKAYAEGKGVTLIEKPIARDALAFMANIINPVDNLSIEQIQGIYTGDIVNWSEVGGWDCEMHPYIRNRNSGSQEKFETMVMVGLTIMDLPEMRVGTAMHSPYFQLEADTAGIAYTPYYYFAYIAGSVKTKVLGVNGVPMTKENVKNDTYPYTSNVYTAVRSDIDKSSLAYRIFEFLTTEEGQAIVDESGYVPINATPTGIEINEMKNERVKSEKYDDAIFDLQGRKINSQSSILNSQLPKGLYIVNGKKVAMK